MCVVAWGAAQFRNLELSDEIVLVPRLTAHGIAGRMIFTPYRLEAMGPRNWRHTKTMPCIQQLQNTGWRACHSFTGMIFFALWNSSCTVSGLIFFEGSVAKSHVQGAYEETQLDMTPCELVEKQRVHVRSVDNPKLACLNRKGLQFILPSLKLTCACKLNIL